MGFFNPGTENLLICDQAPHELDVEGVGRQQRKRFPPKSALPRHPQVYNLRVTRLPPQPKKVCAPAEEG